MKLTKAGGDYHLAVLLLAAVGFVTGEVLFAALGLALAFISLFSLALMKARAAKEVKVVALEQGIRLFKNEKGRLSLKIPGLRDSWTGVEVKSIRVEGPVQASVLAKEGDEVVLLLRPEGAGRFTDIEVKLGLTDAVGLFSMSRTVRMGGFSIDSLPLSLLRWGRRAFVPPLVVGESPAGRAGRGQEFYGVETYTERNESKDILWKRAAKEPGRPLLARVREANNPEFVTVRLVHGEIANEHRAALVDLQCEALGVLGRDLLSAGIGLVVVGPDGAHHRAVDDEELVESIMETSISGRGGGEQAPAEPAPIMMAVGEVGEDVIVAQGKRPVVFVGGHGNISDRYSVRFTGTEDLTKVVNLVLAQ
ncbi:MAG: hypothetical protein KGI38_07870 [Thaumarchaeota archaeon]|nr:hypothetical protein [Nitrososphaerota archaeon]